jgi:hypothetical protein
VNNDDNANPVAGNGVVTLPITLGYNTEPTAGVGNDTNFTLDIGVQANVVTITGSARADTINATTTVAGQPLPTGADDFITGGKGKDTIEALGGNDFIDGAEMLTGWREARAPMCWLVVKVTILSCLSRASATTSSTILRRARRRSMS